MKSCRSLLFVFVVLFGHAGHAEVFDSLKDVSFQGQVIEQEGVIEQLEDEKRVAQQEQQQADGLKKQADRQLKKAKTESEKALVAYLSELQRYRAELSHLKLGLINEVDSQIADLRTWTDLLASHDNVLKSDGSKASRVHLEEITKVWRIVVDDTVQNLFSNQEVELPVLPAMDPTVASTMSKFEQLAEQIRTSVEEASREQVELGQVISKLRRSKQDLQVRLLLNAGRARSLVMGRLIDRGQFSVWSFLENEKADYIREVQVVPYRFLAALTEKYYDFKGYSQQGLPGWVRISKQLGLLVLIFVIPVFIFRLFDLLSNYLDQLRRNIFNSSELDFRTRTKLALWIARLNPYLPWFLAFVTVLVIQSLIEGTLLGPVALILPYINIYIVYRMFRLIFSAVLVRVLLSKSLDRVRSKQPEVQATVRRLSILFFSQWVFLHATEDVVRHALIYNMIFDLVLVIDLILIAFEARRWRDELLLLSKHWLHTSVHDRCTKNQRALVDLLLCPLLFIGNVVFLAVGWIYQWASQFEVGKRVSSEIFKKRLEDARESNESVSVSELPNDYSNLFSSQGPLEDSYRVTLSRSPLRTCIERIEKWQKTETHEDLLVLYGNFGIGKSTILDAIARHFDGQIDIRRISVQSKVTKTSELFRLISEALGVEVTSVSEMEAVDQNLKPTLVLMDDIHNLYLNDVDGLEAYRTLIELSSLQLENIYWCMTCNERALAHLQGLFGLNHFLGEKIELASWKDFEIQDLILKRHKQSHFRLSFDRVISVVHKGDMLEASSALEVQFFRLLWGQSRGNPSTAQELWLSAACAVGSSTIRIAIPDFTNPKSLSDLDDEFMMVLACIVKHENLRFNELVRVCDLPVTTLHRVIKFGEDNKLLQRISKEHWRLHPKAQYIVHAQLAGRNLIYG